VDGSVGVLRSAQPFSNATRADCCINIVDEKFIWLKFGELQLRDIAMATTFVARDGHKLAFPAFIVCAGI